MFEENYDKFANIILSMIDLNLENQLNLDPHIRASMPKEQYAEQFATIRFDLGRRTGKTRFVQEYLSNSMGGSAAIVPNIMRKQTFADIEQECVYTPYAIKHWNTNKEKYRFIFVDEPKLVLQSITVEEIYWTFLQPNELQCFIFIGN